MLLMVSGLGGVHCSVVDGEWSWTCSVVDGQLSGIFLTM